MGRIVFFLFFFLFFLFPQRTFAEDFTIDLFNSEITIQDNGTVGVSESVDVDFADNQKHGIYRDTPYAYKLEDGSYYTDVDVTSVKRNNREEPFEITTNDNNVRIRIGDPNKTISGRQSYTIIYTVKGVLRSYEDFPSDEFYWNVTGNEWETSIRRATARVTLAKPGLERIDCYQGLAESSTPCIGNVINENVAEFSSDTLSPHEGMTIVAGYKKGLFPILTVAPPEKYPFLKWEYFYVFLATAFIGIFLVVYHWHKEGRDLWSAVPLSLTHTRQQGKTKPLFRRDTISVEFEPPGNMRPAEIGVLLDERADTLDITSTIIDLAGRGYLSIKEIDKSWIFGKRDYELTRAKKDSHPLLKYEQLLLNELFATGSLIRLSDLKMTFYDELKKVKGKLYDTVVEKGFFVEHPEKKRTKFFLIGIIGSAISFFLFMNLLTHFYILSFLAGVLLSCIILLIFSRSMSRRSMQGNELYRRALGYKLFISGAEKYRQQFFENKNMLNEVLPYTIVFGLTDKFAKAMERMGIRPSNPTWYTGTHLFTYSAFASDMQSFSTSLSTAMSSAPSSSGSSGGSSGGGFGGGGGGSW